MTELESIIKNHEQDIANFLRSSAGEEVLVRINGVEKNLKSRFVGIEGEKFVIIDTPKDSQIKEKLYSGNAVTIQFLSSGYLVSFQSNLVECIYSPARLMFLSYPTFFACHNIRDQERVDCFIPAEAEDEENAAEGVVVDLSLDGCLFVFEESKRAVRWSEGQTVRINLKTSGKGIGPIKTKAVVCNRKKRSGWGFVGLRFQNLDAAQTYHLKQHLAAFMERNKLREVLRR